MGSCLLTKKHHLRLQVFHISSHFGDDYMLRNEYFEQNNKTVNYEQIDVIYLYRNIGSNYYFGMGEVSTPIHLENDL